MSQTVAEVSGAQLECQVSYCAELHVTHLVRGVTYSAGGRALMGNEHQHGRPTFVSHGRLTLWWTWVETASSSIRSGDVLSVSTSCVRPRQQ
jgi:hypothetical protein